MGNGLNFENTKCTYTQSLFCHDGQNEKTKTLVYIIQTILSRENNKGNFNDTQTYWKYHENERVIETRSRKTWS